jgi:hypothetical protein
MICTAIGNGWFADASGVDREREIMRDHILEQLRRCGLAIHAAPETPEVGYRSDDASERF